VGPLPSPVQARGFLHNYVEFLGLNPDPVLLQYVELLQHRRSALAAPTRPVAPAAPGSAAVLVRRPRWVSPDLLISSVVVLAVIAVLVWGVGRMMAGFRARTLEDAGGVSLALPTAELTPSPTPETRCRCSPACGSQMANDRHRRRTRYASLDGSAFSWSSSVRRGFASWSMERQYRGAAGAPEYQAQRAIEVVTAAVWRRAAFFQGKTPDASLGPSSGLVEGVDHRPHGHPTDHRHRARDGHTGGRRLDG
jgi:hypothetical protein